MWKEKHLEGGREENYRLSEDEMDRREGYESVKRNIWREGENYQLSEDEISKRSCSFT